MLINYFYLLYISLLSNRVELMCQEHKVCELIELLQG